jgi:hypothetical protein
MLLLLYFPADEVCLTASLKSMRWLFLNATTKASL